MSRCFRSRRSLSVVDRPRRRTGGDKGIKCQVLTPHSSLRVHLRRLTGCRSRDQPEIATGRMRVNVTLSVTRLIYFPGIRGPNQPLTRDCHPLFFMHPLQTKRTLLIIFYPLKAF